MVTITRHVFINIFQTEHVSSVKFAMDYEKNVSFFVIGKSPKVWKKSWKDRMGSFKLHYNFSFLSWLSQVEILAIMPMCSLIGHMWIPIYSWG